MMKRILSLFLSVLLLITSLSFSVSAQVQSSAYNTEDAELLYALGVTESPDLTGVPVTRAQFVRYAMKLAGIPISPYNGTEFADVSQAHDDYDYIMSAVDFGLLSISDKFRPEDTVAPNEAFKIIVELLGYDFMAEAKGGYPSGYLQTAHTIDLSKGVNASEPAMTDYDVCTLLCNALKVNLPEVSYTGDGNDYSIGNTTILGKYRGIMEVTGVIDGVSYYSEYDVSGLGDDRISINGTVYNTGDLNCDMLFGYDVVAYYDSQSKCLISCTPSDSNRIVSIYAEDVESFKKGVCVYTDKDSKSRSVSINNNATIFYNGRIFDYDPDKLNLESGSLTFVSPNGSGTYSTLYIKSYRTIVVSRTSMSDEYIIVDKYSNSDGSLVIDPDKTELIITNQDGNVIDFSSIVEGDILNVAVSDDQKFAEIICVKDRFMGTYSGYNSQYIDVDGSEYRLSSSLVGKVSELISLGKQAVFKLDIDRRIADIVPVQGIGEELGYLVIGKVYERGMQTNLAVRILRLDGKIYDYYLADSFSINGKRYKDFKIAYDAHKSPDYDSLKCSIIKYTLNQDGKINNIVYPDNEGGNGGLYYTNSIEKSTGSKFARYFYNISNRIMCNTDMIIFKVPDPIYSVDSINDELYSVEDPSLIYGDNSTKDYKLIGYSTIPDDGMSSYLVMQSLGDDLGPVVTMAEDSKPYMISQISQSLLNGEPREKMELCNKQNAPSSPLVVYSKNESDFSDAGLNPGDIIRINANENNVVRGFEIIWKKGSSTFDDGSVEITTSSLSSALTRIKFAYAYSIRGVVLDAAGITVSPENVTEADLMPIYSPQASVLKYDERLKSVVSLSINGIKDYKNFGDKKTKFIYNMSYNEIHAIFIVD